MAYRNKTLPPEGKRKDRLTLGIKRPSENAQPASNEHPQDSGIETDIQRFEQAMWDARNRWSVGRYRAGLFGSSRLRRADADRALKTALAELEREAAI